MATRCFIPLLGKRLRVTKLDDCGNVPAAGVADSIIVTDGFISVNLTSEVEDGAEIITRKADGTLCVNEKLPNSFKRFTVEVTLCGVNPQLLAFMSNAEPYADYDEVINGITVAEGTIDTKFALELWTGISGSSCLPGEAFYGGYMLLPFVNGGVLGDISLDGENAANFSITGAYTKGGNAWGVGPYDVMLDDADAAAPLPTAVDAFDHLLLMDTSLAPPPSACDAVPMPMTFTSVVPATDEEAGGQEVVITGTGFTGVTGVNFGTEAGTGFTVGSDTQITVTAPAHAKGVVDLTILKTGANLVAVGAFTYTEA